MKLVEATANDLEELVDRWYDLATEMEAYSDLIDLAGEIEQWRDDLIRYGLDELTGDSSNPND
ncbi:hypothetical protein AB7C87_04280 [Natrarchaeobius sp. A-rgal3]|uniref:hypothetical protein n=1 Tax=Natrarchaeobius versutus TaxID=1679078 RepID=UPI00350F8901